MRSTPEQAYARKRQTAQDLDRLVALNARRVAAGDIGEIDLVQSRVNAAQLRGELVAAANNVRTARLAMTALLTPRRVDTLIAPTEPADLLRLPPVGPDTPLTPELLAPAPPPPSAPVSLLDSSLNVDSLAGAAVAARPECDRGPAAPGRGPGGDSRRPGRSLVGTSTSRSGARISRAGRARSIRHRNSRS